MKSDAWTNYVGVWNAAHDTTFPNHPLPASSLLQFAVRCRRRIKGHPILLQRLLAHSLVQRCLPPILLL